MDKELRILMVEDSHADAELEEHELRKSGLVFTLKIVDTKEAFLKELDEFSPDIILSDYDLPTFDGFAALRIAKEKCPDVPFVLVSGKLGEEFAIEKLKEGAADYVLKGNLKRLVPSIHRALKEAEAISEHKRLLKLLKENEQRFRILYERAPLPYQSMDENGYLIEINQAWLKTLGYTREEVIGRWFGDFLSPASIEFFKKKFPLFKSIGEVHGVEFEIFNKDGSQLIVSYDGSISYDVLGRFQQTHCIFVDITERRQAEEALRVSETKFKSLAEESPNMIFINYKGRVVYANKKCEEIMGYTKDEYYAEDFDFRSLIASEYIDLVSSSFQKHMQGEEVLPYEYVVLTKDGKRIEVIITTKLIDYDKVKAILGIITDITERKKN